jgi:hypothetical protein
MPRTQSASPTSARRKPEVPPIPADLADEEEVELIEPEISYAPVAVVTQSGGTADWPVDPEVPSVPQRALAPVQTDHVIVGLGQLAKMSEQEFTDKLNMLRIGRERVELIQKTLMKEGTDYGRVPGIDRPFLHLPGAEVMEKFYGYVAEQRTERLLGDGVTAPPFAYRTDTIVHLGDITGPVVAVVSATCNVWEDRYRYRSEKPTCPECGRPDLIKRKNPPNMAGKWNCPNWGGKNGCNRVFEPNDPRITSGGKIENPDPWGLDETIIQMSQKRSYVAAIRRATGTSGLFTIDEDSPSVKAQSEEAGPTGDPAPEAKVVEGTQVARGGKTAEVTDAQIAQLAATSRAKDIGPAKIADVIDRLFKVQIDFGEATDRAAMSQVVLAAIKGLGADKAGRLAYALETGSLDEEVPAEDLEAKHGSMADHAAH